MKKRINLVSLLKSILFALLVAVPLIYGSVAYSFSISCFEEETGLKLRVIFNNKGSPSKVKLGPAFKSISDAFEVDPGDSTYVFDISCEFPESDDIGTIIDFTEIEEGEERKLKSFAEELILEKYEDNYGF